MLARKAKELVHCISGCKTLNLFHQSLNKKKRSSRSSSKHSVRFNYGKIKCIGVEEKMQQEEDFIFSQNHTGEINSKYNIASLQPTSSIHHIVCPSLLFIYVCFSPFFRQHQEHEAYTGPFVLVIQIAILIIADFSSLKATISLSRGHRYSFSYFL